MRLSNSYNLEDSIDCPGIATEAITVGSIGKDKKMASFTSFGSKHGFKPNIVAPGKGHIDGHPFEGTSFSASMVSGVMAAILNKVGNVAAGRDFLYRTADDLGLPSYQQGVGCINFESLVEAINSEATNSRIAEQDQSS